MFAEVFGEQVKEAFAMRCGTEDICFSLSKDRVKRFTGLKHPVRTILLVLRVLIQSIKVFVIKDVQKVIKLSFRKF